MKKLSIFLFILFCKFSVLAQSNEWNLLFRVPASNNKVLLRWMPPTANDWVLGVTNGYTITKSIYSSAGALEGTVTIPIGPITGADTTLAKWVPYWKKDSVIFKNLLYLSINKNIITNQTVDVPKNSKVFSYDEERNFFANLLADQRFKAAELCGLGYTDNSVVAGKRYAYTISVNVNVNIPPIVSSSTGIINLSSISLPDIPINFTSENRKLKINWGNNALVDYYSGYYIEKSVNAGASYTRLNNLPYLNLAAEITQKMVFGDSIPNANASYRYRVLGISYFDEIKVGTFRDTTIVKKQELSPGIRRVVSVGNNFRIDWRYPDNNPNNLPVNVNTDLNNYIVGVSRKDNAKLGSPDFKVISSSVSKLDTTIQIAKSTLILPTYIGDTVTNKSIYYYYVVSIGVGGAGGVGRDTVYSMPFGYKPTFIDKIGPAKVTGSKIFEPVEIPNTNDMVLKISWNNTTDNVGGVGLLGYQVFRKIGTDPEKIEVSGGIFSTAESATRSLVYDTFSKLMDFKSVTYYITAFDSLYNASPLDSVYYGQKDKFRPLPAKITSIFLKDNFDSTKVKINDNVEINFIPSPSKKSEVIRHELRRRESTTTTWTLIKTILPTETITSYIDNTTLEGKTYYYTLSAVDDSSNYSCDSLPSLVGSKGFPTTPKGCITEVEIKTLNLSIKPAVNSFAYLYSEANKSVTLNWAYSNPNVVGYEIYRGTQRVSDPVIKAAFLTFVPGATSTSYIDSFVDFDSVYLYKIRPNFLDGSVGTWASVQTIGLKNSKLALNKTLMSFERTTSSQTINITSNINWTVVSNATWLTTSVGTGSNNQTITITATANTGTSKRLGLLTFTGSGLTQTVDIEQYAPPTGTGLTANYYNLTNLIDIQTREANISRLETQINLGTSVSPLPGINENFVAVWEGEIEVPQNGDYTFYLIADDGAYLSVDNKRILSISAGSVANEVASPIQKLLAGQKYPIKIEYWDVSGYAGLVLKWSSNVGLLKQAITTPYIYPKFIPVADDSDPLHNQCFVLRNPNNDRTVQTPGDFTVIQKAFNSKNSQKWKFVRTGTGYKIISQNDPLAKTLQTINNSSSANAKIVLGFPGSLSSEVWNLVNQGNNVYFIQRAGTTLNLGFSNTNNPSNDDFAKLYAGTQNIRLESTTCPNYSNSVILDTDELTYDYKQQSKVVQVKSDNEWTVVNPHDWISFSPPYGLQSGPVNVMVAKNDTMAPREGFVTFKNSNGSVNLKINQNASPCLQVNSVNVGCSAKGIEGITINNIANEDNVYEFMVDNTNSWKAYSWQVNQLTNGNHVLYVRRKSNPSCTGSIPFSIYCY